MSTEAPSPPLPPGASAHASSCPQCGAALAARPALLPELRPPAHRAACRLPWGARRGFRPGRRRRHRRRPGGDSRAPAAPARRDRHHRARSGGRDRDRTRQRILEQRGQAHGGHGRRRAAAPSTGAAAASASGNAAATSSGPVSEDWPAGASGWTVELSSLDSSAAHQSDVSVGRERRHRQGRDRGRGARRRSAQRHAERQVRHLLRTTSPPRAQAQAAQAKLIKKFPGALLLHVTPKGSANGGSSSNARTAPARLGLDRLVAGAGSEQHLSGKAYEKASSKLPVAVSAPGARRPPTTTRRPAAAPPATCIGCWR